MVLCDGRYVYRITFANGWRTIQISPQPIEDAFVSYGCWYTDEPEICLVERLIGIQEWEVIANGSIRRQS